MVVCMLNDLYLIPQNRFNFFLYKKAVADTRKRGRTTSKKFPLIRRARATQDDVTTTENLKGRPGQGYYIAILIGTPPQRVSGLLALAVCIFNEKNYIK